MAYLGLTKANNKSNVIQICPGSIWLIDPGSQSGSTSKKLSIIEYLWYILVKADKMYSLFSALVYLNIAMPPLTTEK